MSLIIDGQRIETPGLETISWLDDPKVPRVTDGRRRVPQSARAIVLHTVHGKLGPLADKASVPSVRAERYARYQASTKREVSWHLTIDTDGTIVQSADVAAWTCWHATAVNGWTVGIELVQEADGALYRPQLAAVVALGADVGLRAALLRHEALLTQRDAEKGGAAWDRGPVERRRVHALLAVAHAVVTERARYADAFTKPYEWGDVDAKCALEAADAAVDGLDAGDHAAPEDLPWPALAGGAFYATYGARAEHGAPMSAPPREPVPPASGYDASGGGRVRYQHRRDAADEPAPGGAAPGALSARTHLEHAASGPVPPAGSMSARGGGSAPSASMGASPRSQAMSDAALRQAQHKRLERLHDSYQTALSRETLLSEQYDKELVALRENLQKLATNQPVDRAQAEHNQQVRKRSKLERRVSGFEEKLNELDTSIGLGDRPELHQ